MLTESWYAALAFRRRVSMSAIGSVIVMAWWPSSPRFPLAVSGCLVGTYGVVGGYGRTQVVIRRFVVLDSWLALAGRPGAAGFRVTAKPPAAPPYQLDLVMPGSSPRCAISRKQMRHSPNLRYTARGRPQREHLV